VWGRRPELRDTYGKRSATNELLKKPLQPLICPEAVAGPPWKTQSSPIDVLALFSWNKLNSSTSFRDSWVLPHLNDPVSCPPLAAETRPGNVERRGDFQDQQVRRVHYGETWLVGRS
jgi:hypothetical protein